MSRVAAAVTALLLILPAALPAQEPQGSERERQLLEMLEMLEGRTDSIRQVRAFANAARNASDTVRLDTVRLASVDLVTARRDVEDVTAFMRAGERRLLDRVPGMAQGDRPVVKVRIAGSAASPALNGSHVLNARMSARTLADRMALPDDELIGGRAENILILAHQSRLPRILRDWAGSLPLGGQMSSEQVYIELAASPGIVHECFVGESDSCLYALGLRGPRRWTPARASAALSVTARRSFATYILRSDTLAYQRLVAVGPEDRREPAELLALAANRPLDEVVDEWRAEIFKGRPERSLPVKTLAASMIWVLLFTGLAARSTRWRLG